MNKLIYFFLMTLLVLSCSRCKEEDCTDSTNPDCPNYVAPVDPCAGKTEVSAEFVIEELISALGAGEFIPTDTTLKERHIRLRATIQGATEYKWYVGSEIITDVQSVTRFFPEQWAGSNIPITLVVRKIPDNACFPNDDGYDSITKVFHISQYLIEPNPLGDEDRTVQNGGLQGTYRLIQDGMQDSIDVGVSFCDNYLGVQILFENLDGQGTICTCDMNTTSAHPRVEMWGYRYVKFGNLWPQGTFCKSLEGFLDRKMNGLVVLNVAYRFRPEPNADVQTTNFAYTGRKIN
jgi:hypothetical protein